jgi:hypothetical protein
MIQKCGSDPAALFFSPHPTTITSMKTILTIAFMAFSLSSCKKDEPAESPAATAFKEIKVGSFTEADFSPWLTKAEQQLAHETKASDNFYLFVEGRNNGGLNQYRHVLRKFPVDDYKLWSVYWGLSAEEFYQVDLKMLRDGFTRANLQVFLDSEGRPIHQCVWLKK